jgi:hypothetical protein
MRLFLSYIKRTKLQSLGRMVLSLLREGVSGFLKFLEIFKLKNAVFSSSVYNLHGKSSVIMPSFVEISATLW